MPDSSSLAPPTPPVPSVTQRLISAFILIGLALAVAIVSVWTFAAWVGVLAILMMLEWQSMTGVPRTSPPAVLQSAVVVTIAAFTAAGYPSVAFALLGLGAVGAAVAARIHAMPGALSAAGVFVVGMPAFAAVWMRGVPDIGLAFILWLFAVVWASDSGAFTAGRLVGGPAFARSVSPNKTWAGVIGGFMAALAGGIAAAYLLFGTENIWFWVLATTLAAVAAQAGDISESAFKRYVGVKDSGTLIPGHGGVFDRLDGFLMAAVVSAICIAGASLWIAL